MSATLARHRKSSRSSPAPPAAGARHRKRRGRGKPARTATAAVAGAVILACGGAAAVYWLARGPALAGIGQAEAAGGLVQWPAALAGQPQIVSAAVANRPGGGYRDPLRAVSRLTAARIDDGVDFAGVGAVYALGDAVITRATGNNYGWPGGGWITYRLTGGPAVGLVVYVAEDIIPAVRAGQRVSPSTVIGTMFNGGDGIETGWAQPTGASAEAELPVAGAIGGYGPFPTRLGVNFDELLRSLGAPAAPNRAQPEHGRVPPGYPASWG